MKLFKLNISGNDNDYKITYTASSDFMNYKDLEFQGNEQEKFNDFLQELQKNGGPQPVNIKMKMATQATDRALSKSDILSIGDVDTFIDRLKK